MPDTKSPAELDAEIEAAGKMMLDAYQQFINATLTRYGADGVFLIKQGALAVNDLSQAVEDHFASTLPLRAGRAA